MKITRLLVTLLAGGLLGTSAIAGIELPRPIKVTAPSPIARHHDGAIVKVALTVDPQGRVRDVAVERPLDTSLARRIEAAAAGWQFTPARQDGEAVSVRVVLPLHLEGGNF